MLRGYGRAEAYRGGNKVYRSGANSPHQGTKLDPKGYVDRELNKPRVQKRSRLAQSALLRMRTAGGSYNTASKQASDTPQFNQTSTNSNKSDKPEFYPVAGEGKGGKGGGNNNPPPDPTQPDPYSPPKVDLNGKLIPMPWEMQMDWINATNDLAQQNAQWDTEANQANIGMGISLRELAKNRLADRGYLADAESAKGMSFSSGNAAGITNIEGDYANQEADIRNYVQDLMGRIGVGGTDRALAQSQFDQYATMLQAEAARRLAEQAGTLGLGETDGDHIKKPITIKRYKKAVNRLGDGKHDKKDIKKFTKKYSENRPGFVKAVKRATDSKHDKKDQKRWIKRHRKQESDA